MLQQQRQQVAAERRRTALMWVVLVLWLALGLAIKAAAYHHWGW